MLAAFLQNSAIIFLISALVIVFRYSTEFSQAFFLHNVSTIYFLPLVGVFVAMIGLARVETWWALLIKTNLSQLFGASTGREHGLLAASRDLISKIFGSRADTGVVAAFAGCFIAPISAIVYIFDVRRGVGHHWKTTLSFIYVSLGTASVCSLLFPPIGQSLMGPSTSPTTGIEASATWSIMFTWSYIKFALTALVAVYLLTQLYSWIDRFGKGLWLWLSLFLGGIFVIIASHFYGLGEFNGLGTDIISQSTQQNLAGWVFAKKMILTALSRGFGWFGGDFTPLLSIGMSFGNEMAQRFELPISLREAALSTSTLFLAARHRIWLTGLMLTWELGGLSVALLAAPMFLICFLIFSKIGPSHSA